VCEREKDGTELAYVGVAIVSSLDSCVCERERDREEKRESEKERERERERLCVRKRR